MTVKSSNLNPGRPQQLLLLPPTLHLRLIHRRDLITTVQLLPSDLSYIA